MPQTDLSVQWPILYKLSPTTDILSCFFLPLGNCYYSRTCFLQSWIFVFKFILPVIRYLSVYGWLVSFIACQPLWGYFMLESVQPLCWLVGWFFGKSGNITPGQSEMSMKGWLHTPQSYRTGASPLDAVLCHEILTGTTKSEWTWE